MCQFHHYSARVPHLIRCFPCARLVRIVCMCSVHHSAQASHSSAVSIRLFRHYSTHAAVWTTQCACISLFIARCMCLKTCMRMCQHFTSHCTCTILGTECTCNFFDSARPVRHLWPCTAHEACAEQHCTCAFLGTVLRIHQPWFRLAHASISSPQGACAILITAMRVQQVRIGFFLLLSSHMVLHAHCWAYNIHARVWFAESLNSLFSERLGRNTGQKNRQGALIIGREKDRVAGPRIDCSLASQVSVRTDAI